MRRRGYAFISSFGARGDESGGQTERSYEVPTFVIAICIAVAVIGSVFSVVWTTTHTHTEKAFTTMRGGFSFEQMDPEHVDYAHSHQIFQECWRDADNKVLCAPTPLGANIKLTLAHGNGGCTHTGNLHIFLEASGTDYPMKNTEYESQGSCNPPLDLNTTHVCTDATDVPSGVGSLGIKTHDSYGNVISRKTFATISISNTSSPQPDVAALLCA